MCVCVCVLRTSERYTMKNISPSNPLQFPSTEGLINKQKKRMLFKSAAEGTLSAYRALVMTKRRTLTAVRQGQHLQRTHQQSNHQGGPQRSALRLKTCYQFIKEAAGRELQL